MSCSWIVFQGGFLLKSPLLVENYSPNARHAHTAYGKCSQNNEKHMKRTILAAALIAQTSAWAALETVDFSVLPAAADITAPGQLSLGPVTFSYDGFGAGTASIDSTGITGQAGGNLLMSFATPATTLNFTYDFGGNTAAPGDLTLRVFTGGGLSDTLLDMVSGTGGSLNYTGAPFDSAQVLWLISPPAFHVSDVSYELAPVPEPGTLLAGALLLLPLGAPVFRRLRKQ